MHYKVGSDAFPVFDKVVVNGPGSHEAFVLAKAVSNNTDPFGPSTKDIAWNYEKFLVNASGVPVKRFMTTVSPIAMIDDIRALLRIA